MEPHKLMKVITLTVFLAALFLLPASSYPSDLGDLRISLIDGDVQIKTIDTGDWVPASINAPLMDGDILWVPEEGRAAIQLRDGSYVRLDENTSLEVLTLEKNSHQFYLTTGRAYVNFKATRGSFLQVDTPISSIRAFDLSIFRVDVGGDDFTRISVIRGKVDAESRRRQDDRQFWEYPRPRQESLCGDFTPRTNLMSGIAGIPKRIEGWRVGPALDISRMNFGRTRLISMKTGDGSM